MKVHEEKADLRAAVRAGLKSLDAAARAAASQQICDRLRRQPQWRQAERVLLYAPASGEPDVWPLLIEALASGKTAALPRYHPGQGAYGAAQILDPQNDVVTGKFGLREPRISCPAVALNRLDLVLVPGVAFDLSGRRLGRGQGFYDRLLGGVSGLACGVAFDRQIVGRVPVEPHDVVLSCILTPTRWQETGVGARF